MAEQSATVDLNDEEILQFIEINKAANTVRTTRSDLNVCNKWCATANEHRKVISGSSVVLLVMVPVSNASCSSHQLTGNNTVNIYIFQSGVSVKTKPSLCLTLLHQERKDAKYIFKISSDDEL